MKKLAVFFFPVLFAVLLLAVDQSKIPPMPAAVSDNAVVALRGGLDVYSLMGIGAKKTWTTLPTRSMSCISPPPSGARAGRCPASVDAWARVQLPPRDKFFFSVDIW